MLTWVVLVLVLARQVVTLLENAALLDRLSASQAELSHQAHHDPLTGLANRALFSTRLEEAIERHRRLGEGFAVLVIDLDDFKAVNDAFGHAAGDHLLYAVARAPARRGPQHRHRGAVGWGRVRDRPRRTGRGRRQRRAADPRGPEPAVQRRRPHHPAGRQRGRGRALARGGGRHPRRAGPPGRPRHVRGQARARGSPSTTGPSWRGPSRPQSRRSTPQSRGSSPQSCGDGSVRGSTP